MMKSSITKYMKLNIMAVIALCFISCGNMNKNEEGSVSMKEENQYYFVDENQDHEGTWITWPHKHTYGEEYADSVEYIG